MYSISYLQTCSIAIPFRFLPFILEPDDSDDADDEFAILYFQQTEGLVKKKDLSKLADNEFAVTGALVGGRRACGRADEQIPKLDRRRRRFEVKL
ncbi:uncharacterized protein A4U43_C03F50 [Asparagus officinalis]|uniref:Uncharacterized protein n=1 Tax=Asparagus officinalis TaxID=4686 RepID=A0A5P1F7W6_ASPOF|nr:uncharacterized protein A4U43_C03F50 [Asparagus officinalis]